MDLQIRDRPNLQHFGQIDFKTTMLASTLIMGSYDKVHPMDGSCIFRNLELNIRPFRTYATNLENILSFDGLCLEMLFYIEIPDSVLCHLDSKTVLHDRL
jgi:hypothetical protein